jgi:hypothetical protein
LGPDFPLRASVRYTNGTSLRKVALRRPRVFSVFPRFQELVADPNSLKLVPFVRYTDAVFEHTEDESAVRDKLRIQAAWGRSTTRTLWTNHPGSRTNKTCFIPAHSLPSSLPRFAGSLHGGRGGRPRRIQPYRSVRPGLRCPRTRPILAVPSLRHGIGYGPRLIRENRSAAPPHSPPRQARQVNRRP